ncbi:T9SS type A sorting domain-containing protein [Aquimarina latercula]|uniref:T9SS type A sorting domain-containing protein n=1 Tax=Aquimarina latercula TaxID=987 RepID=UPI00042812FA|nr:T9SS type A sorting domain-containing protein [Aquimarina latercula]
MKKQLFFLTFLFFTLTTVIAQSIGVYGSFNSWPANGQPDLDLNTTDNVIYTLVHTFTEPGDLLFRQDDNSEIAYWGTFTFPEGTAIFNGGDNFQHAAGTYTITFNINTLEFSFDGPNTVGLIGDFNGFTAPDIDLSTTDGINYSINGFNIPSDGNIKFRQNDGWAVQFGGNGVDSSFPSGIAQSTGNSTPNIFATAGTYDVSFNIQTLEYSFTDLILSVDSFDSDDILGIKIYPNPTDDIWYLTRKENIISYNIYDVSGKSVKSLTTMSFLDQVVLNAEQLDTGFYFLQIETARGIRSISAIKR